MTILRQLGYGLALLTSLGLLFWGQYQKHHAVQARETLTNERKEQAEQRIRRQANTITTLAATLASERMSQISLRTMQSHLRQGINQREQQIEVLKRENSDLRHWAARPLPSTAQRLRNRPAFTGAAAYRDWLSRSSAMPASGEQPQQ